MISVRRAKRGYRFVNKRRRDLALGGEKAAQRAGFAWPIILALSALDADDEREYEEHLRLA